MLIFLATWAEITHLLQITFQRGDSMYHRFLQTAWLAPKESNINEYQITGSILAKLDLIIKTSSYSLRQHLFQGYCYNGALASE